MRRRHVRTGGWRRFVLWVGGAAAFHRHDLGRRFRQVRFWAGAGVEDGDWASFWESVARSEEVRDCWRRRPLHLRLGFENDVTLDALQERADADSSVLDDAARVTFGGGEGWSNDRLVSGRLAESMASRTVVFNHAGVAFRDLLVAPRRRVRFKSSVQSGFERSRLASPGGSALEEREP